MIVTSQRRLDDWKSGFYRSLLAPRPRTDQQLHTFIQSALGFSIPHVPIVADHQPPFAYIAHAFFDDRPPRDMTVWANRGGGKTQLGAIATFLDLVFKPGIQIRILGGSFEQSSKMYRYLTRLLEREPFDDLVAGKITGRAVELTNGSRVEVLSQSERAVRGQRVHKLRCDEVELFDEDVWIAAQLVTRGGMCGDVLVPGSIETLSTMHRPFGLMHRLVRDAAPPARRIFRWSLPDVLERCEPQRRCDECPLWDACRGRAKTAFGFLRIDDAIQQRRRVGQHTWNSEMLCERPSRSDSVYPEFEPSLHVSTFAPPDQIAAGQNAMWIGGLDFGFRNPTVLLWAFVDQGDVLHVIDEMLLSQRTVAEHLAAVQARPWPLPLWIGADPAGLQRSEQTGRSIVSMWREAGFRIRTRGGPIEAGVLAVRARLRRADGGAGLFIHRRCESLIQALTMYHYPPDRPEACEPVKDGSDHACDALRYMIVNLDQHGGRLNVRRY